MDEIYERLSLIINREPNVTLTVFNESGDIIYTEKMTAEQYHKRNFKKKYNFVPDKDGSTRGTITVDGKKVRVDLNDKKPTYVHPKSMDDEHYINLGKDMFRTKGSKSREFILQHELGHSTLHALMYPGSNISKEDFEEAISRGVDEIRKSAKYDPSDNAKKIANMTNSEIRSLILKIPQVNKAYDKINEKSSSDREKARVFAKKYEDKGRSTHANAQEFEADRYAANRTSDDVARKTISNMYKRDLKDIKKGTDNMCEDDKSVYGKSINYAKSQSSKIHMLRKKLIQNMDHLDRHPEKDPGHEKRDELLREVRRQSKIMDDNSRNIKDERDELKERINSKRSTEKKKKDAVYADINSRLNALKDRDLKDNSALKNK